MARAVAAEVALFDPGGQGLEGHLRTGERRLLGRDVAVAELAGEHQIGFAPEGDHRLVAPAIVVMAQGTLLVAFDDGGVLIHGGDLLLLAVLFEELGDLADHAREHAIQSLLRDARGHDEALLLLTRRAHACDALVVEAVEEGAGGTGLGRLVAEPAHQTGILCEQGDILRAIAAKGLE